MTTVYNIDKATENTEYDKDIQRLIKHQPERVAFEIHAKGFKVDHSLIYHKGCYYLYDGLTYAERTEREVSLLFRLWLKKQRIRQTTSLVNNVVPIIQAFSWLDDPRDIPFLLNKDSDIDPRQTIAFQNGLFDVRSWLSGKVVQWPLSKEWLSTFILPYDYEPTAKCPNWLIFLHEVFDGDAGRTALLQEYLGLLLTTEIKFHRFLVLCGVSRAGKGLISRIAEHLVGRANSCSLSMTRLVDRFSLANLKTKQLATINEVELSGAKSKNAILEVFKDLTGGDPISLEKKCVQEQESIVLPTRFLISCNQMPHFFDTTGALGNRMLILNFNRSFAGKEDRDLLGKLLAELPGIAVWALEGLRRLHLQGDFTIPACSKESLEAFRRDASPVLAFLQDRCVVNKDYDSGNLPGVSLTEEEVWCISSEIYTKYLDWCKDTNRDPRAPQYFRSDLQTLLPKLPRPDQDRRHIDKVRVRTITGIDLKQC